MSQAWRSVSWLHLLNCLILLSWETQKPLISTFRTRAKLTGVPCKNGSHSAWFGRLEELLMKLVERPLISWSETSSQCSQETTQSLTITSILTRTNGKDGKKRSTVSFGNLHQQLLITVLSFQLLTRKEPNIYCRIVWTTSFILWALV